MNIHIHTYLQPLPEHGVYTVFVELGDTKIEVCLTHTHTHTQYIHYILVIQNRRSGI